MTTHTTHAVLVPSDTPRRRGRAELHAMAFLARYRVDHTRKSYGTSLAQWFGWCEEHGIDPLEAKRSHIEVFARELEQTGRKLSTVSGKLNALAGFYRYAVIDELIDRDPMVHVRRPQIQRVSTTNGLTVFEFARVIKAAEKGPSRDHAIVCLLGYNGLRVSEVCGIDIEHLGQHQGSMTVKITRKGGKVQTIPLAPRTAWQVDLARGDRTSGPRFLSVWDGRRIDRRAIGRIVGRLNVKAGITKRVTPHSYRHAFVTMALDAGVSERDIALSTGHADTRMVTYYDRNRDSIERNATHAVAARVEGVAA